MTLDLDRNELHLVYHLVHERQKEAEKQGVEGVFHRNLLDKISEVMMEHDRQLQGENPIQVFKQCLLEAAEGSSWCIGIGVGLVNGDKGLVVSVIPGSRELAEEAIERNNTADIPIRVREVGEVRKR